jgi:hypothetical protein
MRVRAHCFAMPVVDFRGFWRGAFVTVLLVFKLFRLWLHCLFIVQLGLCSLVFSLAGQFLRRLA